MYLQDKDMLKNISLYFMRCRFIRDKNSCYCLHVLESFMSLTNTSLYLRPFMNVSPGLTAMLLPLVRDLRLCQSPRLIGGTPRP